MSARFFVITGGPGSGKTALISALARQGLATMPEAGRAIIRDQSRIGGSGWHGSDRRLFAELMLQWELRSWHEAQALEGPVLFDRGLPDVVGYLELYEGGAPGHMHRAAEQFRYHATVFFAPPWRQIFAQDAERAQDFDEAVATSEALQRAYAAAGYKLQPLPLAPVAERARVVLDHIARATA